MKVLGALGDLHGLAESAIAEVERLEAEVERLQQQLGECQVGFETGTRALKENMQLVKDAARYQWLRDPFGPTNCLIIPRRAEDNACMSGAYLDEKIDAAIAQEKVK